MPEPLQLLKNVVDAVHPLDPSEWDSLAAIWKPFKAKRKEILTQAGQKEDHLYFVVDGVQRVFYFDEQQREATLVFTYAPSFGGVLDSFLSQQPSHYSYETLTPSTFIRTSARELFQVIGSSRNVATFVQKGTTQAMSGLLERMVELQCYSSEEKFKALLKRSPHILQLVPHKYLANYIGIDATNFSKLMNSIRI
ncbi:MAG TPA: Crp/Fnr family transcriptional regulator [Cyclobacteriaceae bacterium]|jgi:CRP-like cAMP-binding protein|nr:Crp/Fnr family transcriptional regulator [Cyclobacteriaceae bacterium]